MPASARLGDTGSGHGCWPPRPNDQGSPNVFANNIPVHRVTDHWAPHTCPPIPQTHDSVLAAGSPNVFANNLAKGRIGDPVACGSVIATGSPNVWINGGPGSAPAAPVAPASNNGQSELAPGVTVFDASVSMVDEEDNDFGAAVYPPLTAPPTPAQIEESTVNGYNPNTPDPDTLDSTSETTVVPPAITTCDAVNDYYNDTVLTSGDTSFNPNHTSFQLSPRYTLEDLTTGPIVSTYIITSNNGLSETEIICNLQHLAINILEPFYDYLDNEGKSLQVNSGFRHGSGSSQHLSGQAVDIQIPGASKQDYWDIALWIKDNLPYDQFILEYGGTNPWFHISFSGVNNRTKLTTRIRPGKYVSGLVQVT